MWFVGCGGVGACVVVEACFEISLSCEFSEVAVEACFFIAI